MSSCSRISTLCRWNSRTISLAPLTRARVSKFSLGTTEDTSRLIWQSTRYLRLFSSAATDEENPLEKVLSKSMANRVLQMTQRHDEIMSNLQSSSASTSTKDTKELTTLAPVSRLHEQFINTMEEIESIADLKNQAAEMEDEDIIQECDDELNELNQTMEELGAKLMNAILPRNEDDFGADAVMEIRAGTGGDEACLFCGELLESYQKIAKSMGWKFEILSETKTDLNGVKEAAVAINGSGGGGYGGGGYGGDDDDSGAPLGPYGYFKFESGVHRVQRVPVNDVRIHTSAASIAVLPAPSDSGNSDELLPMSELRIETMRASGAGGQHVNTTDSAVRITHIPTGIVASIQDERSQHKNKAKALKLISARVRDKMQAEAAKERGEARNALLGGGDRSERIRTYNYPQDRITDHRCKHSEHGIVKMLSGSSGEDGLVGAFAPFLREMERKELLASLEEEEKRENNGK